MKVVSIDFETANRYPASVCAIGMCTLDDGAIEESYYSLIKPLNEVAYFSNMNIRIHGIREKDVKDAPTFNEIYQEIEGYFSDSIIVAHNAMFDMTCLKEACKLANINKPKLRYIDSIQVAKRIFPNLDSYRLNVISDYIDNELDHHNALSDAKACLMIIVQAMNLSGIYDIEELCRLLNIRIKNL